MTTRKQLIIEKYLVLESELMKHVDGSIFPSLDEIDLTDMVFFMTMTFVGVESEKAYHAKIRELIEGSSVRITEDVFEKIAPLIIEFIAWLKVL
jgi:hypothetical protein